MKALFLGLLVFATLVSGCSKTDNSTTAGTTPINTYKSINLGNVNNSSYGSFVNLRTGQVYFLSSSPKGSSDQSNIDLVFWYNSVNVTSPYLGGPASVNVNGDAGTLFSTNTDGVSFWTTRNNTIFYQTTKGVGEFDNVNTLEDLKAEVGDPSGGIYYEYDVLAEHVYVFKTVDNKVGMLKINTIVGSSTTSATMNVDIKVQQ